MDIREHLNPIAFVTTATAVTADVVNHGLLTAVSVLAALVGIMCHITQTVLKWQEREEARKQFKLQCFREWDRARD